MFKISDSLALDDACLRFRFVRSSGPGGQNVNKLNTRAQLVFDLKNCTTIHGQARLRLITLAGSRHTADGTIIIESDKFREQLRNRNDCLARLRQLILHAMVAPKKRIRTRPTIASKRRRLQTKQRRSQTKSLRQQPADND
jgi:ribosome-associated protein